jgi:ceramide glucosyltransferase
LTVILLLGWLAAALAVVGTAYGMAATLIARLYMTRPAARPTAFPPLSVIKPLHGAHPGLAEDLEGFCLQDYPGEIQLLFGVHTADDPAAAVVRAMQAKRPDMDIELVVDRSLYGTNRKVSNLINIAARARNEVLVLSDADIGIAPDYLGRVVGALQTPGVGAVTCLYVGKAQTTLWARLGAMGINYHFLPNAMLGKSLKLAQPCFGSTIALTRAVLDEIGGLPAFADHLADDYEMGRAVRGLGYAVAIPPMVVSHTCVESTASALIRHELRWGRTVRQIDPLGYAGSLITNPLPLALIAGILLGFSTPAWVVIFGALGVRIGGKFAMDASTGASAGRWWLIPARDILSFGVFVASFAVTTVGWSGQRFRVGPDGVLSHI